MGSITRLLFLSRAGRRTAFANLFERIWPRISKLAKARSMRTGLQQREDDIAQSAMIRFWEVIKTNRLPNENRLTNRHDLFRFLGILLKEAHGKTLRYEYQKKRALFRNVPLSAEEPPVSHYSSVDGVMLQEILRLAMTEMSSAGTQAVSLYFLDGLTAAEVGNRLSRSERTIERYLFEFRARFKEKWDEVAE